MENIKLKLDYIKNNVSGEAFSKLSSQADKALKMLHDGTGKGNDFLGWVNLPSQITEAEIADIEQTAKALRNSCEYVVTIGIGGSYLGTKAVCEALNDSFQHLKPRKGPVMLYAGHNIGEDYMHELVELLKGKAFGLIVISKSGTTTEPALAFRILKELLENQVGKSVACKRIVAVTDKSKGALRTLAEQEGYKTYAIPDDVGGRYSVLTPVGLIPIAVDGLDIRALVKGAVEMEQKTGLSQAGDNNMAINYAVTRNVLYQQGKKIEIMVNFHPKLHYLSEWWKQLYGESEGKDGKGIFPAAVDFSTDLHSMGQWIQEGERTIFETVISVSSTNHKMVVPSDSGNLDKLNFLAGKNIDEINKQAEIGTRIAHMDGGVPNLVIEVPLLDAYYLGQLIYFFEKACGISGYLLDVNPFDQPGVEAYKKNMFALLGKPGFEEETKAIKSRL